MFCVAENTFCFMCCNHVINGHVFPVFSSLSSPSVQEHALLKVSGRNALCSYVLSDLTIQLNKPRQKQQQNCVCLIVLKNLAGKTSSFFQTWTVWRKMSFLAKVLESLGI